MIDHADLARVYREVLDIEQERTRQREELQEVVRQKRLLEAQAMAERAFLQIPTMIRALPPVGQMHVVVLNGQHLEHRDAIPILHDLINRAGITLHYIQNPDGRTGSVVYFDPSLEDISYMGKEIPWPTRPRE